MEGAPAAVLEGVPKDEAEAAKAKLEGAGEPSSSSNMHLGSGASAPAFCNSCFWEERKLYGLDGRLSFEMKTVPARNGSVFVVF